ncbi:hypothetical protein [Nosocomiicoccus sp. HMSC059G07]|uniref:hypothetical protein n=1 Tax=Nosocomiicoccus sp. HMSC059G07 TaxID=1739531 RepID=UPI0008A47358|nr:hypothetical protein [Nosocomiicoccus sp. HMSC059G07]OFO55316.1 hypothetical protein HMPREF3029_04665 [Nosocomiicoccus sp. HMSC059G07]
MKKIVIALMLVMCVIVLAGCGNNPKSMFEDKTYFAEPTDGDSTFLLEFQKDGYVKLIYPQLNNASEIGTYSISEEKYDDKYHIRLNIDELGHDDYLFDDKEMMFLGVNSDTLKYDPDSYFSKDYDFKIKEYNN